MKKFKFTLESVMRTKEIEQDQIKEKLAEQNAALRKVEKEIEAIIAMINDYIEEQYKNLRSHVNPMKTEYLRLCISDANREKDIKIDEKIKIEKAIDITQEELAEKLGEIKALEKIKERQYEEYAAQSKVETENAIEEFILARQTEKTAY